MLLHRKGHIVAIQCENKQNYLKLCGVLNSVYEYQTYEYKGYYTCVVDMKTKKYTDFLEWLVYHLFKPLY